MNLKPKRDKCDKNVLRYSITLIFIALYEYCIESPSIQFTHRNYTIIYRFTMAVSTHYNLQKNLLYRNLKILNIKKGTVEETGINLAASNRDWEVAACMSLNMGTGKY